MFRKKLAAAVLGALMFNSAVLPQNNFLPAPVVCAEIRTIEADGYYIMGDGMEENQGVAKERAREDAKRAASEQACTFIESISEIKNGNLTRDEIRTFSATVLQIISSPVKIETNGDSMVFHCRIIAKVDTANVMAKLHHDRQELDEVLRQNKEKDEQMTKLNDEMNILKRQYKTASVDERKKINAEVKRNEEQFTSLQWNLKGKDYYNSGDYNKAVEALNKAIELNQNLDSAWNNLGAVYSQMGSYSKALDCFYKAIELNPRYDNAWNNMGITYFFGLSNIPKAIECFNIAIELNPDKISYKQNRDVVLSEMK